MSDGLNQPFTWRPQAATASYEKAVLLIHGLLDSPYSMQDLGRHFLKKGYLVQAILLAGHGTTAEDLIGIHYSSWCEQVAAAITKLSQQAEKIILCGFSLGSSLAIFTALNQQTQNKRIEKLILFAPALKSTSLFTFITNWHRTISWALPRAQWYRVRPSHCPTRYESIPYNALHQSRVFVKRIRQRLQQQSLTQPLFIVMSADDETVCSQSVLNFFQHHTHPHSKLVLYSNAPPPLTDNRVICRNSAYPNEDIIDFSHVGLHIAPDNVIFGRQGTYQDFLHYPGGPQHFHKPLRLGAITHKNLKKYTIQRLCYNPDLHFILEQFDNFLTHTV